MFDGKDDAEAGHCRVEVLTGPGRRRRWSAEEAQIAAEAMAPGAMVSAVARRWQLSLQQVFGWRREARAGLLALPVDGASAGPPVPDLVPIFAEPAVSAPAPEAGIGGRGMTTIPSGVRMLLATRPVDFRKRAHGLAALASALLVRTRSRAWSWCSRPSAWTG